MGKIRWSYIVFAYLGLFVYGMADSVRSPVFPEFLRELELSQSKGSLLFALSSGLSVLASFYCYSLIKRFGMDQVYAFSLGIMALGCFGFYFSASLVPLLLTSILIGFSLGTLGVMVNLYISVGAEPQAQQKLFSGLHGMYGLASFVAPLFVVGTQWFEVSWRNAFLCVGVPVLVLAIFRWFSREQTSNDKMETERAPEKVFEKPSTSWGDLVLLSGLLGWYVVAEIMVSSRLTLYLMEAEGASLSNASTGLSLFFAGLLIGRLSGAFFQFPFSMRKMLVVSNLVTLVFLLLGILWSAFFLILSGLSMALFYPVAMSYISTFSKGDLRRVMSVCLACQSLLTMIMHLSVGFLSDALSVRWALLYGVMGIVISTLCLYFYEKRMRSRL